MFTGRNKLYLLLLTLVSAGYIWLFWHVNHTAEASAGSWGCIIKKTSGYPCPACGTTRGLLALSEGNPAQALHANILAFPLAFAMLLIPVWIMLDFFKRKDSFLRFYTSAENVLRRPKMAVSFSAAIAINWAWNFYKGL